MSSGYGQRLRLRLFIEGVEVPVIAATVQVAPNSPAACSIQIPPLPEGTRFLPRSLVHLFFMDFYEVQNPFPMPQGALDLSRAQDATAYQRAQQAAESGVLSPEQANDTGDGGVHAFWNNFRYKLLFGGEVVGFQWTKNQANRSLVLQCQDWSNYWDYAQQWNNTDIFGPGIKAMFSGGSTNLFTDILEDEGTAILRIITTPSHQYPKLQGLLGGIVHLIEAIGGSYYEDKKLAGENIFFSLAELRLHISQLITAYEDDPTAKRLIGAGYDYLLGRTLGGLGQQVSIRQAINALMGVIFHETYAQPCPAYETSSGNTPAGVTRKQARQDPNYSYVATVADGLILSIDSLKSRITGGFVNGTSQGDAKVSVTTSLTDARKVCRETAQRIREKPVLGARSYYASALRSLDQAQAKARSWYLGSSPSIVLALVKLLDDARAQMVKASQFEVVLSSSKTVAARLNQQIFRPDVWFSAPPRCNVIFPEHYHSMNYQRQFMTEPTRLLLKTNDEFFGEDELFDQFYFAPKGFTLKSGRRELQDMLRGDVLDHELFTGIIPVFEKMGELNIFAARSGTVKGKKPKIGLAQRSTNFLYFKYRFAARMLQVSGKFNPYLACGFPALVIDKYVDPDLIARRQALIAQNGGTVTPDMNQLLGTHFLCNLTDVVHSVDQGNGSTQLNCSYARQPEESVEFLGAIRPDQTVRKRYDKDATRTSVIAAISPPRIHSLGPNQGDITAVEDVTEAYTGQLVPLYQGSKRAGTDQPFTTVSVGKARPADEYGADIVAYVGSETELVLFRAFKVSESLPRYRREIVDLPAEEYIRPGWYGDIWHPSLIGKAYQKFFQTGAITDQQQVQSANGGSIGVPFEKAEQALREVQQAIDADDPKAWSAGLMALDQDCTIESAVGFIVDVYSRIKSQHLDVDDFIRNYTWRPIATMVDMLGSSDLVLGDDGVAVINGVEGFHSRAFGPYEDLFGLTTPDIENVVGIKKGTTAAQRGDTRKRKQQAVLEYVSALSLARAILG